MELILTIIFWAVIIGIVFHFAQIVFGLLIWLVIGVVFIVTYPFRWAYNKINENR